MNAAVYEIQAFGYFGPPAARRRLWVPPGRALSVSQHDTLTAYVDRQNGHEQVAFWLRGPAAGAWLCRQAVLAMYCEALNFRICARAIARDERGRARRILIELVNLQLAARAS